MRNIILTCILILSSIKLHAQRDSLFSKETYTHNEVTLPYRLMLPENYDASRTYPLVIFLHGAGERGNNNEAQLINGAADFFAKYNYSTGQFPAIVIAPQCPANSYWSSVRRVGNDVALADQAKPTPPLEAVISLVNHWIASGKVDVRRVYVGGLSMGGIGTLELLWRMPQTFAAAFPICGGADLNRLNVYAKNRIGMWIFHGDADPIVPVQLSRNLYAKLQPYDFDVRYTEYPGVEHNSWTNAFQETALMPWLFGHRK